MPLPKHTIEHMKKNRTALPFRWKQRAKMRQPYLTGRKHFHSVETIIKALENNGGYITKAAEELGCTHPALLARMKREKDGRIKDALKAIKEARLDDTENVFFRKIREGDVQCILYHLKTHGKTRGYGTDNHVQVDKNLNWQIEVVHKVEDNEEKNVIDCTQNMTTIDCTKQLPATEENADYTDPTKV